MNVLLLSRYTSLGASSRYRSYQYLPYLRSRGHHVTVAPLLSDLYLRRMYNRESVPLRDVLSSYLRRMRDLFRAGRYDLLWIEYEALPWIPFALESLLLWAPVPYVVDYDDAVFHRYDMHSLGAVRTVLGNKIDRVMRDAALVIAGNGYLASRAVEAGAARVEILPTVVDLDRYPHTPEPENSVFTIGWIGSPTTAHYLPLVREPLELLCRDGRARVVVIGAKEVDLGGVPVEIRPWSEQDEVREMSGFDVGIMPLKDSPWERGKCGHKLIKYMACARPVVASPVGMNRDIVREGVNGFLASGNQEWVRALSLLRENRPAACEMGKAGRKNVEQRYCTAITAPVLEQLLMEAAPGSGRTFNGR